MTTVRRYAVPPNVLRAAGNLPVVSETRLIRTAMTVQPTEDRSTKYPRVRATQGKYPFHELTSYQTRWKGDVAERVYRDLLKYRVSPRVASLSGNSKEQAYLDTVKILVWLRAVAPRLSPAFDDAV